MSHSLSAPHGAIAVAFFGAVTSSTFAAGAAQALAEISGGLSANARDAAWLLTLYDLGQLVGLPLVWIAAKGFGRGRAMALAGLGYAIISAAIALASDLSIALPLRLAHGVFGGMMPVFMMLMVMSSLRPGQGQAEGMAAFALTATIGAGISASLASGLLNLGGWRALFWAQAGLGMLYAFLANQTLREEKGHRQALTEADWQSYALLSMSLGAIVVAVSEGVRRFWFETWWVTALLVAGAVGLVFTYQSLRAATAPLLRLSLFTKTTFSWALAVTFVFRAPALLAVWAAPLFLMRAQGFTITEIGDALIIMAPATLIATLCAYALTRFMDPRLPLTLGLALFASAAWTTAGLTSQWAGEQVRLIAALAGAGQALVMVPILRYAVHGVGPIDGLTCGYLFNLARLLGQVCATAGLGHLVAEREKHYWAGLGEAMQLHAGNVQEKLAGLAAPFAQWLTDPGAATGAAMAGLARQLSLQAHTLALSDALQALSLLALSAIVLTWALPSLAPDRAPRFGLRALEGGA